MIKMIQFLLKFILALLNSKTVSFYSIQREIILLKPGKTPQLRSGQRGPIGLRQIPVPSVSIEMKTRLADLVDKRLGSESLLEQIVHAFLEIVKSRTQITHPSRFLQHWPSLDFKGFLAELKKGTKSTPTRGRVSLDDTGRRSRMDGLLQ